MNRISVAQQFSENFRSMDSSSACTGVDFPPIAICLFPGPNLGLVSLQVACFGASADEAFLKALMSTGFRLPKKGILIGIQVWWLPEYMHVSAWHTVQHGTMCLHLKLLGIRDGHLLQFCSMQYDVQFFPCYLSLMQIPNPNESWQGFSSPLFNVDFRALFLVVSQMLSSILTLILF